MNEVAQQPPDFIVTWLWWAHGQYPFVGQLLVMMMLDILTGIGAGFVTKKLCSSTSQAGMGRKIIMLMAVVTGVVIEPYTGGIPTGKLVAVFYTFTEGISILENLSRAGVPIPKVLSEALEKLKSQAETKQISVSLNSVNSVPSDGSGSEKTTTATAVVTESVTK